MSVITLGNKERGEKRNLATIVSAIQADSKTQGSAFAPKFGAEAVANFESMSSEVAGAVNASLEDHFRGLKDRFENADINVSNAQLSAGALLSVAAGNPSVYQRKAYNTQVVSQEGVNIVPVDDSASYGYVDQLHPSLEAFDNSNLLDFVGLSVMYTIQAARQDAFSEAFFRTTVVTPDNGGVDIAIRNQLVFNHFLHDTFGTPANFNQRRLLDAAINYQILSDNSTTLLPEVLEDDSNAEFFVSADAYAPRYIDLGNRTVRTAPLKIDQRVDLIGISQNNLAKKNGVADNTDSLDRMTGIKNVYMQIGDGDVLRFNLNNLPKSYFVKSPEGRMRQQFLHYATKSQQLNAHTLTAADGEPTNATLQTIIDQKLVVMLGFTLTGDLDTEFGNISVNGSRVEVVGVYNAANEKLSLKEGVGRQIVDGLKALEIIGWDPNARLSNANRRERGLQLNNQEYVERYPIPLGPPISIPSPLAENRDAGEMNSLIAATRLRNSNNAVTKLISYADALNSFVNVPEVGIDGDLTPEIEGIARFLIHPWFKETTIHLPDIINSLTSADRINDVQAVIVNTLRNGIYAAYRDSNIQTALDAITGYTGEKVKVLIGTDAVLGRYIVTPGDTRTIGDGLDFVKVTSMDKRIYGDIYYTFIREGEGIDPLNFGSHLWIPELISNVQVSRNNAQFREAMVQNRSRHVVHLPILGRIRVTGLEEAVGDRTTFQVNERAGATDTTGQNAATGTVVSDGSGNTASGADSSQPQNTGV